MSLLARYSKFIIFGLLLLIGIQIPGFVSDYKKNLQARFAESQLGLTKFQETADRHFNGSLENLVEHYKTTNDPVVAEGGDGIQALVQRHLLLTDAIASTNRSVSSSYSHLAFNPVTDIRQQVWDNYDFTILLSQSALGFGLIFALLAIVILELIIFVLKVPFRSKSKRRKSALDIS
ncbi:MAG: DUF2937 family protein [Gammaproteobacteria bacterium]|nr:DUF2937 family protein [Gammaproteobacteria bacterium]